MKLYVICRVATAIWKPQKNGEYEKAQPNKSRKEKLRKKIIITIIELPIPIVARLVSSIHLFSDSDFLFHATEKRPNIKRVGRKY